ncbi:MAG: putative metalloprotease CJM1_0395 family protein [Wenzhouxiangella sp.]|jgi:hypothetical protein|nr:putative metalloprotease CJM1_0395 family protein [Wenzhouxiangella sp.]
MQIAAPNSLPPVPVSRQARVQPESSATAEPQSSDDVQARVQGDDRAEASADRGPLELTEAEQALVRELQQRDREVRAHELAHVAAGGPYVTRPASYQYQIGPDGRRYAVGGEVSIDTSVPADPEEALAKAQIIQRAALAPIDPSPQDYQVAAQARQMEAEARQEIAAERLEEMRSDRDSGRSGPDAGPVEPGTAAIASDGLAMATEESLAPTSRFSLFA